MTFLRVDNSSLKSIQKSFDNIAEKLFNKYQLQVNNSIYRLVDIEFYYFSENHPDIYAHKHEAQLKSDKWYFHGSGIDITFGDGNNHGGILIRAIVKISNNVNKEGNIIEDEFHGPVNVKTEICSNFNSIFENKPNIFQLNNISKDLNDIFIKSPYFIRTNRINLTSNKEKIQKYYSAKYRYVAIRNQKYVNKMQIARDMKQQYPEKSIDEINKLFGWKILK